MSVLGRIARLEAYYNDLLVCVRAMEESIGRLERDLAEVREAGPAGGGGGFGAGVQLGRIEGRLAMLGESMASVEHLVRTLADGTEARGAGPRARRPRRGGALDASPEPAHEATGEGSGDKRGRILEALLSDNLELLAAGAPGKTN